LAFFEVQGLTKYFGGLAAVNGLSFHLAEREILALIGPNGAGKSTVFNLITSFLRPTSGRISFQNRDITHQSAQTIAARGIVRTFQQTNLFMEMSALQNVMLAHHLLGRSGGWGIYFNTSRARGENAHFEESALKILDYFGLHASRDDLAKNLPHGHQRALGMAIALAANPKLLLLDEPFTGMNPQETETAMRMIQGIRDRGITMILVEHDMRAVMKICDRIVVINFGKKIAEGNPREIQKNEEVINAYLGKEE
jgi:branched-chain amino acid transport system ATP-binding protein